eukprot:Skav200385  [mRNA]  locus=scaffold2518:419715:420398:- [translate_table: standard]
MEAETVVVSIEKLLQAHQKELLNHLDSWADRVVSVYSPAAFPGRSFASSERLQAPADAPKKKRDSYNEARLASVQVIEARTEAEMSAGLTPEKKLPAGNWWQDFRKKCKALVEAPWANALFAALILSNSIFLGVQLEMQAASQDVTIELTLFTTINVSYAALFSFEVALHLIAAGPTAYLWQSDDVRWNWLDLFVVFASWIELLIFFVTPGSNNMGTNRPVNISCQR